MDSVVLRIDPGDRDDAMAVLWSLPILGIAEVELGAQLELTVGPDAGLTASALAALIDAQASGRWRCRVEPYDRPRAERAWREHAQVVRIGDIVVRPLWVQADGDDPASTVIDFEPGDAWGTGAHPTTRLAGALLLAALDRTDGAREPAARSVLDVGCGSGVLSLVAAAVGSVVTATDIAPEALAATRDNAARNGLHERVTVMPPEALEPGACFDVVVANLGIWELEPVLHRIVERCRVGGTLVLSGLWGDQLDRLDVSGEGRPVRELDRRHDGSWVAAALQRVATEPGR